MLALVDDMVDVADDTFRQINPDQNYFNSFFESLEQPKQSNYFSTHQYNQTFKSKSSEQLTIINANVRSFHANGEKLVAVLSSLDTSPDVLILTETWLGK